MSGKDSEFIENIWGKVEIIDNIKEHPNEYLYSDKMIAYTFEKELHVGINVNL